MLPIAPGAAWVPSVFGLYHHNVPASRELLQLTPVYEQVEGGWTQARLLELPGVITAAPTRAEAEESLLDALREFLLSFTDGPATPHNEGATIISLSVSKPSAA